MTNWISVNSSLPPPFERVLVYDPSIPKFTSKEGIRSHNYIVIGYYRGADSVFSPWMVPDGYGPTHWMSLPEDPSVQVLEDTNGRFISTSPERDVDPCRNGCKIKRAVKEMADNLTADYTIKKRGDEMMIVDLVEQQTQVNITPCDCYPAVSEAMGCLHVIRYTAKDIERWKDDPNFSVDDEVNKIVAYGLKMHVLLGGNMPGTFGEACIMQDFPECEPHEWDNMTMEEQKVFLAERWGLASQVERDS